MRASSSGGYELLRGGRDYEPQIYPLPPAATGYHNMNSSLEARIPKNAMGGSVVGNGGHNIPNVGEVPARVKLQDHQSGGSECVVEIRGSTEHLTAAQSILQSFMGSAGGQNINAQQGSYPNMNTQQQQQQRQSSYQNMNAQPSSYQSPYQNINTQQSPYQNINTQQSPYLMNAQQKRQQGAYPNLNASQSSYHNYNHNMSAQQGTYQLDQSRKQKI